ncbi:MAG: Autotransporter-associated beta strand repeat protein, partial [Verrucomicrobiaceae bacterium]|nr:Autotransporter-associated beta strand repeat protein [Verrucomicrobiaceae bacterium]
LNGLAASTISGTATTALVKQGGNNLLLGPSGVIPTASSTFAGGITVMQGLLQANATATAGGGNVLVNQLGNNTITLMGGNLSVQVDDTTTNSSGKTFNLNNNNVVVNGNATVTVNRNTGTGTGNIVAFNGLTIGGQTLTLVGSNSDVPAFNSVLLTNLATFSTTNVSLLQNVTDGGAGLGIIRNGAAQLYFGGAAPTLVSGVWTNANGTPAFSGGVYVNPGASLRFGTGLAGNSIAQAGIGNLYINPGASIQLEASTNINTAAGQKIDARSTPAVPAVVQLNTAFDPSGLITSTSSGLLAIPATMGTALNLSNIGDGTFHLAGATTYSATTMVAGAGNVYRLGGNNQAFTITAANNNVLTGATRLQIGGLALTAGAAAFTFNNTNNYSGGTTISRGAVAQWSTSNLSAGTNTPLGTGPLDVFGGAIALTTSTGGAGQNGVFNQGTNTVTIHPGATVTISNAAATVAGGNPANRWAAGAVGGAPINLNGATFSYVGPGYAGNSSEIFTNFSFNGGARVLTTAATASSHDILTVSGNFTRSAGASLVFQPSAGNLLGAPIATSLSQQFFVSTVGQQPVLANGMAPGYIVDGTSNQFVTYGANGFVDAAYTAAAANLPAGRSSGTDIAQVTGSVTLADNPVLYALGFATATATVSNAAGQINTITLSGTGASASTFGGIIAGAFAVTINPNIKAGSSGQFELPIFVNGTSANATILNGDIAANGITKFGAGTLTIGKDQSDLARGIGNGYNNGWVVNEGQITLSTFGSLGNVGSAAKPNLIKLNGSAAGAAQLNLNLNQTNTLNATYTSGRIIALDNATIAWDPQADDRTQTINDVQVQSTGGVLLDAQMRFTIGGTRKRSVLETGVLSLVNAPGYTFGGTQINVGYGSNVSEGVSTGVSVAALSGDNRLTKWGAGTLYVRGDSTLGSTAADGTVYSPYTGAVSIEQGALQLLNPKALGTGAITVKRAGTLDINTVGYLGGSTSLTGSQSVTYQAGSIERWSADGARAGAGIVNLGGATLQIANDQSVGSATILMNGGSIEGFLAKDSNIALSATAQGAVYRTVGAGYSFVLNGNSFLGQSISGGVNGLDNGVTPSVFVPLSAALTGVLLDIKGSITGTGSLTKQGYDTITLSGANSYTGGTNVNQGWLRAGATNTMPLTGALSTTGGGVFDLNGFDLAVGKLSSPSASNASGSGYITNTSTQLQTLTVGNGGVAGSGDSTYGGVIQYNV